MSNQSMPNIVVPSAHIYYLGNQCAKNDRPRPTKFVSSGRLAKVFWKIAINQHQKNPRGKAVHEVTTNIYKYSKSIRKEVKGFVMPSIWQFCWSAFKSACSSSSSSSASSSSVSSGFALSSALPQERSLCFHNGKP